MIQDDIKKELVPFIEQMIAKEIIAQGHKNTGKIIETAETLVKQQGNEIVIQGLYEYYAQFINKGVKASSIQKSKFAKAAIEALTVWARRKGFSNPRSAAFAIRQVQAREGMPTRGSYKYSSNGKRLDAFDDVLQSKELTEKIDSVVGKSIERSVNSFIERNKKIALSS